MVGAQADATLQEFFANVAANNRHPAYPMFKGNRAIGTISLWEIAQVPGSRWNSVKVGEVARANLAQVELDTDLREVVRLMNRQQRHRLVLIIDSDGAPAGLITPSDILLPSRSRTKPKPRPVSGSNPMQQPNGHVSENHRRRRLHRAGTLANN